MVEEGQGHRMGLANPWLIIGIVVVVAVAGVVALSILTPYKIIRIPGLVNIGGVYLSGNNYIYIIGYYKNIPLIIKAAVYDESLGVLSQGEGVLPLTSSAKNALLQLAEGSSSFVIKYGNPNAPVWVFEFLDPVCPYCTFFDVFNFSQIVPLAKAGDVYLIFVYFPTHALGYYEEYEYYYHNETILLGAFNDSVALWYVWKCVEATYGSDAVLNAINETYFNNMEYIYYYYMTNNPTYVILYPFSSLSLMKSLYGKCNITMTPEEAYNATNEALRLIENITSAVLPSSLLNNIGTPMFIIIKNPLR